MQPISAASGKRAAAGSERVGTSMTDFSKFLDDDQGAITIDWVALTAGLLLLGIMVVYAIFNGGVAGLVSNVNATLAAVTTDVDTGDAPDLNGITTASALALLSDGRAMPVGAVVQGSGLWLTGTVLTQWTDPSGPAGNFFQTVSSSANVSPLAVGTTISGADTFDVNGTSSSSQVFLDNTTVLSDPWGLSGPVI